MILFNGSLFEAKKFPIGETMVEKEWLASVKKEKNNTFVLKYESDADLFHLLLLRKSVWFPVDLWITYMPYSRMDRTSKDYVFTLKALGKYINWLDFQSVHIFEPHSDVTPAIINKVKIESLIPELLKRTPFNIKEDAVLYPDAGAQKKYSTMINSPNELVGFKQRDFKTGKISKYEILGKLRVAPDVYIIDDLCSKGGTFIMAAEQLKKMGAGNIYLVVAHCEETITKGEILKTDLIKKVYTTDSILFCDTNKQQYSSKLEVFHLSSFM